MAEPNHRTKVADERKNLEIPNQAYGVFERLLRVIKSLPAMNLLTG
jgi:hypothetical protein